DETTHGLSDKVLDRAFTLEFWDVQVDKFPRWEAAGLSQNEKQQVRALLEQLGGALAPARMHFGWRTIGDVIDFVVFGAKNGFDTRAALDSVVYSKILPKLRGDSAPAFSSALTTTLQVLESHGLVRSAT